MERSSFLFSFAIDRPFPTTAQNSTCYRYTPFDRESQVKNRSNNNVSQKFRIDSQMLGQVELQLNARSLRFFFKNLESLLVKKARSRREEGGSRLALENEGNFRIARFDRDRKPRKGEQRRRRKGEEASRRTACFHIWLEVVQRR